MCSEKRKWIEGNLYSPINHWGLETCISRYLHIVAVVLFDATMRPMPLVGRCWHEKPARMYLDPVRWRPGTTGQKRDYLLWKVNGTQWVKLLRHNRALPTGIWIQVWSEKDEISVIQGWFVWWFSSSLSKFVCLFAICLPTYIFQIKFCALSSQNS